RRRRHRSAGRPRPAGPARPPPRFANRGGPRAGPTPTRSNGTMGRSDREITKDYSRSRFVAKLRRLADSLESGKPFTIQVAGERLRVPADVRLGVEQERTGSISELEFQLLWWEG